MLAIPEGLEPSTYWLEVSCSIQLSYGTAYFTPNGKQRGFQNEIPLLMELVRKHL